MSKQTRIDVRLSDETKADFKKVAEFKGLHPSALLHSFIVKTIYETKKEHPEIFEEKDKMNVPTMTLEEAIADNTRKK